MPSCAKITTGTNEIVADCDLVVEAALEKMELKKEIFKQLEEHLQAGLHLCYQHFLALHYRNLQWP